MHIRGFSTGVINHARTICDIITYVLIATVVILYFLEFLKAGVVSNYVDLHIVLIFVMSIAILKYIIEKVFTPMYCLFCKIASGEVPCEKVYEDEHTLAFLDIFPLAKGHTMVIPKMHVETILDLPNGEVGPLFDSVKRVTGMIQQRLAPDGFNMGANMHKVAGQAIDHLHIHIIPRWHGDGGGSMHSIVKNPPQEDLKTIAGKIRS